MDKTAIVRELLCVAGVLNAAPHLLHVECPEGRHPVDMMIEDYGLGTLSPNYEHALEKQFGTTSKEEMMRRYKQTDEVPVQCQRQVVMVNKDTGDKVARELLRVAGALLRASLSRHCEFYLAVDGNWYMDLAGREYGEQHDSTTYGPFRSQEAADEYLSDNFSNPGGDSVDDTGDRPVPKRSPNGMPVQRPGRRDDTVMTFRGRRF
jgi:hypothetical protein